MAYPNGLFSAFSFIGFLLCLIPLYWHIEAWNVGTTLFMAWAGLGCLNGFINSVVWNHSIANVAPVWCDISTRFMIGLTVGLPASLLVINRRLYKIASRTDVITTKAERLRAVYVDLAIGLSIPLLQMILQIVVEGHRFDILEEVGCQPSYYNVALAFPLSYIWAPIILTITLVYGLLNMRHFWRSSRMFNGMLGSNKNPNQNRYNRLIALSAAVILTSLPLSLVTLYITAYYAPLYPWISWDDTHSNYSEVNQFPSVVWRANATGVLLELNRWIIVIAAFLFFGFFGFAEEARKHYRKAYSFASSSLRLPDLRKSRASASSPPFTPSSSFGNSFKKGMATFSSFTNGFSALGSRGNSEITTTERKSSFLVSEYRLTSSSSIFEGVDNPPKALENSPGDDNSKRAPAPVVPASRSAIEALAAVSNFPVPPPPIARVSVRSLPPGLYPAFPHSPTASDLYAYSSEAV